MTELSDLKLCFVWSLFMNTVYKEIFAPFYTRASGALSQRANLKTGRIQMTRNNNYLKSLSDSKSCDTVDWNLFYSSPRLI